MCIACIARCYMRRQIAKEGNKLKSKEGKKLFLHKQREKGASVLCFPCRLVGSVIYKLFSTLADVCQKYPLFGRILGFICGTVLSLMWFLMMVYQLDYRLNTAVIVSAVLGTVLSLGLAFNTAVRCIVCLVLPGMCTGKGRGLVLSYAFVLVMTHPFVNFRTNMHVTSQTLICTQELASNMTRELTEAAAAPFAGIIQDVQRIMDALVNFSKKLEAAFIKVRNLFIEVIAAINSVFEWLGSMVDVCNENMGEPYRKCASKFDNAYSTCKKKMGPIAFTCEVVKGISNICHVARVGELLCMATEAIKNAVKVHIADKIKIAMNNVQEMFYFKVDIDYHYNVTLYQSKTFNQIRKDIQKDIEEKLKPFSVLGSILNVLTLLMLFLTFIFAALYRRSFLKKDAHDNWYITQDIKDLDVKREEMGKLTILPLKHSELKKYIDPFSCWLIAQERKKVFKGIIFYLASIAHGGFFMMCDFSLWWVLNMIRSKGGVLITEEVPSHLKLHVQGNGIMADIYRSLITQFDPLDKAEYSLDTNACLPHPSEPNWSIYATLGTIYFVCLVFVFCESYLLRLRHVIAGVFYPDRKNFRAVYLYSHILRRRASIVTYFTKAVAPNSKDVEGGCLSKFLAKHPRLEKLMRPLGIGYVSCISCGASRKKSTDNNMVNCENLQCKAIYCDDCLPELNNLCVSCMCPIDYSHLANVSEERDSSDEDVPPKRKKKRKKHKK